MIAIAPEIILYIFLLFCRIGGCLMLMPGFSSPRVPVQMRLFIAIAVTLALAPLLIPDLQAAFGKPLAPVRIAQIVVFETMTGALIGLMGRFFFLALQFMATSVATLAGFGGQPGTPVEDGEPLPAIASLITLTATILFFLADLHWEVFRGLKASYVALPVGAPIDVRFNLVKLTDVLAQAFLLTLQITSPFIIYALVINFAFGILNKLTPQIPVYFISLPFVIAGGILLLYFAIGELLQLFIAGFGGWLEKG